MDWEIKWKGKWTGEMDIILLKPSSLILNPITTLFSFFPLKNQKYNYFNESGSREKELNGKLEESNKPEFPRVWGLSIKGLYFKRERSLFEVHSSCCMIQIKSTHDNKVCSKNPVV